MMRDKVYRVIFIAEGVVTALVLVISILNFVLWGLFPDETEYGFIANIVTFAVFICPTFVMSIIQLFGYAVATFFYTIKETHKKNLVEPGIGYEVIPCVVFFLFLPLALVIQLLFSASSSSYIPENAYGEIFLGTTEVVMYIVAGLNEVLSLCLVIMGIYNLSKWKK